MFYIGNGQLKIHEERARQPNHWNDNVQYYTSTHYSTTTQYNYYDTLAIKQITTLNYNSLYDNQKILQNNYLYVTKYKAE